METKKIKIKPFSFILLLLSLSVSLFFVVLLIRKAFVPHLIKICILIFLAVFQLICILIAILGKRKWFQCILSVLLIICATAGTISIRAADIAIEELDKIFTQIPEQTTHKEYLINYAYYMIIDEVDNTTIETAVLKDYKVCDIQPLVDDLKARNADLNLHEYDTMEEMIKDFYKKDASGAPLVLSMILPDEYVESIGEVFPTDFLLSKTKVKFEHSEQIDTNLNITDKPDITKEPFTVLVAGNDARGLKSDEDFMNRSDIHLLLSVDPEEKKILMSVLPYDLKIDLEKDPSKTDRLTYSSFYGIRQWEESVSELLDCPVDYCIRINYSVLADLIDHYDGIEINNSSPFQTFRNVNTKDGWINPGYYFRDGNISVDGSQTLIYLRETDNLANGYEDKLNNLKAVLAGVYVQFKQVTKEISLSKGKDFKDTIGIYQNDIRIMDEYITQLHKAAATDLDTKKLLEFILNQYLQPNNKWTFEKQILDAEYSLSPCYSANGEMLMTGVIPEQQLQQAKANIRKIID